MQFTLHMLEKMEKLDKDVLTSAWCPLVAPSKDTQAFSRLVGSGVASSSSPERSPVGFSASSTGAPGAHCSRAASITAESKYTSVWGGGKKQT